MRLSRIKRREIKLSEKKRNYLLFLVVLPISALLIGYIVAEFIVIPNYFPISLFTTSKEIEQMDKINKEEIKYTFPEAKGIFFQLGSFERKENALDFCQQLKSSNIPTTIWQENRFIVVTGGIMESKTIKYIEQKLQEREMDFFVREIILSSHEKEQINKVDAENLEGQVIALQKWMEKTIANIWNVDEVDNNKRQQELLKITENLEVIIESEIGFIKNNHPWNNFIAKLKLNLSKIKEQPSEIHNIYKIYTELFEAYIQVYD